MNQEKNCILQIDNETLTDDERSLISFNLSLSPEEKLLNHQRALETINEIIKARDQIYGEFKSTPEKTP